MVKYAIGQCHWEKRDTADSGHDLVVDSVSLTESISSKHANMPSLENADENRLIFLVLDLTHKVGPVIIEAIGYLPGQIVKSSYDMMAKCERARNEIVGRALTMVLSNNVVLEDL